MRIYCICLYQRSSHYHTRDIASPASRRDATRGSSRASSAHISAAPVAAYCIVCILALRKSSNSRSSRRSSPLTCLGSSTCRGSSGPHHPNRLLVSRRRATVGTVPDFALLQVVEAASMAASARRGGRRSRRPSACMVLWAGSHQRWGSRSGSGRPGSSSQRWRRAAAVASTYGHHGWRSATFGALQPARVAGILGLFFSANTRRPPLRRRRV